MTQDEIESTFNEAVKKRGIGKKLEVSKQCVYNYRHRTTDIAKMLEVLWKLDKLEFKIE